MGFILYNMFTQDIQDRTYKTLSKMLSSNSTRFLSLAIGLGNLTTVSDDTFLKKEIGGRNKSFEGQCFPII